MNKPKGHVLITDDEEQLRFGLSVLLSKEGYKVSTAQDGETALNEIDKHHNTSQPIDLLVCDIQMPGTNGEELIDALNHKGSTIPIIVISGYCNQELALRLLRKRCEEFIEKPFTGSELVKSVNAIMDRILQKRQKEQQEKEQGAEDQKYVHLGKNTANLLHDLNNNLGTMGGYCELLKEKLQQPEDLEYCQKIEKSYFRSIKLINEMITLMSKNKVQKDIVFQKRLPKKQQKGKGGHTKNQKHT